MRKTVKVGTAALMLVCMASQAAAAATGCVSERDMTAIKAAAIQQRLMVAALSCNAVQLYNDFVRAYQKELQASDRALQNFFRRLNGASGTADYHAFKTRLANSSSMQSIGDMPSYCAGAKVTFEAALTAARTTLAAFVTGQTTPVDNEFSPCQVRTASAGPKIVPIPREKPAEAFVSVQAAGAIAPN